ncbi:MAG TPA: peptidase E [Gaiellaceae bacterium]|nr:peptidase E [Gaiellaceae bacterium]
MPERHIVAIGGGDSWVAFDYVLELVRRMPRLLWVGTAGAEDAQRALRVHDHFHGRADVRRLEFFPWPPPDLRELVLSQDVILVGGGNTANMLAIWRVHGVDVLLREAWERGTVLCGSSAGMICWFDAGVTDSFGPQLTGMRDGLGLVPGSACPHYDDETNRRPVYRRLIDDGFPPGYAADAGVGLHFAGTELAEVLSPRDGATAYRVEPGSETPLAARLLG